eukprot:c20680_g2_i3 orf=55-2469(-)
MERSRFPAPCKKLIRHSPRSQSCERRRGYILYAIITLLLFCMLAIFHSKLGASSAANASHLAHLFTSPVSQRDSKAFKISSLKPAGLDKHGSIIFKIETHSRDLAQGKLEEGRAGNGSLLFGQEEQEEDEDEDTDTDTETAADVEVEEDLDDNAEGEGEEETVEGEEEVELASEHEQRKIEESSGGESHGLALNHTADKLPTWILGNLSLLNSTDSGKVSTGLVNNGDRATQVGKNAKVSLFKLAGLGRWDPLEDMGSRSKSEYAQGGRGQELDKNDSSGWSRIRWDHLLGVVRKVGAVKSSSIHLQPRKIKPGDDEPSDPEARDKLEEVATIEDALLLKVDKKSNKGDAYKKDRAGKGFVDPLNPINNPLLQDPDTSGPSGLSGSDRAILKALRRANTKVGMSGSGKLESGRGNADTTSFQQVLEDALATDRNSTSTDESLKNAGRQLGNAAERAILGLSSSDSFTPSKVVEIRGIGNSRPKFNSRKEKHFSSSLDTRKWGFYPGLDPDLAFSEFMDQFLEDGRCSHNIFMVWTTPPWTYTVRYQRGLESLLHFHPRACVVVFSETIELDFFKSFVEDGFRVAVVVPNLEELLDGTPAAMFASFWLSWRKTHFFYIHYSELLRLASLYKYGGIYLDSDVVLLKPLDLLPNTIGAEKFENQTQELNGAVMAFNKSSTFLLECLVEFMATYDDELLDFNGAGLVTRVAKKLREEQNKNSELRTGDLWIEQPYAFFPLSSEHITRYFKAPDSKQQQMETDLLFESIYNRSRMLHLWNQKTQRLVPEAGSLVERIINSHCIRCHEYL